jgi:hypothetical protein
MRSLAPDKAEGLAPRGEDIYEFVPDRAARSENNGRHGSTFKRSPSIKRPSASTVTGQAVIRRYRRPSNTSLQRPRRQSLRSFLLAAIAPLQALAIRIAPLQPPAIPIASLQLPAIPIAAVHLISLGRSENG